jgi:predicted DNA-binding protein
MNRKATTLRLPKHMEVELIAVARAVGKPMPEAICEALELYIVTCRSDPQFKERVRERLEEDREVREVMEKLAGAD